MNTSRIRRIYLWLVFVLVAASVVSPNVTWGQDKCSGEKGDSLVLENDKFKVAVDKGSGAIWSLVIKEMDFDLISEKRLAANFRICLPLKDYQCNYIDGMKQTVVSVDKSGNVITARFSGMSSEKGKYPIDLSYTISLIDDQVRFGARLTNHFNRPISEFWFPRLGGWTQFGSHRDAKLSEPGYANISESSPFKNFPGRQGLGAEAAEACRNYPELVMPWWHIYDAGSNMGLYLGYHDQTFRLSSWHMYLYPTHASKGAWMTSEEAGGDPVGLIFSHVRYPFIKSEETFETGEFIIRIHEGDWHKGSKFYRDWFMQHFPFDKSKSWLRRQSAWFTSIIYQPEDRIIADYELYDQWCKDAQQYGIDCFELIGWDSGGLERDYPKYAPEKKLGGRKGFRKLLKSIDKRGGKCLVFTNYNILDSCTDWYRKELHRYTHQDEFGNTPNWMGWGESTLIARKQLSVRRHLLASIVPPMEKILEDHFLQLVKDGAQGFQIDKVCVGSALDFNPLNTEKPDVALYEGLVQSIARMLEKCRKINPEFCLASEAVPDRLIPYVDVYYRSSWGFHIAPLRYVFPEWTSCLHVSAPRDFRKVNGAVLTGSVICVEPHTYQASLGHRHYRKLALYIKEVERIRKELLDIIFLGAYHDTLDAKITEVTEKKEPDDSVKYEPANSGQLHFRTHGHRETDQRAIVVVNSSGQSRKYLWEFLHADVGKAMVYEPFQPVRTVSRGTALEIEDEGLQILVERR